MKIQKTLIVTLAVFLASCTMVSAVPTSTPEVVPTPSVTQAFVPSSTATPQPSETNTQATYSSEPYPDSLFTEQLSSLVLTPADIPALDINYLQLTEPEVEDLTNDIQTCDNDCVKVFWKENKIEGSSEQQLAITLIRMDSDLQAAESARASWDQFSQVEPGMNFTEGEIYFSHQLPSNSKVGIRDKEPNVEVMFIASKGPIFMMFIHEFQASRDLVLDFGRIQQMAVLQIEKLEEAGYPK